MLARVAAPVDAVRGAAGVAALPAADLLLGVHVGPLVVDGHAAAGPGVGAVPGRDVEPPPCRGAVLPTTPTWRAARQRRRGPGGTRGRARGLRAAGTTGRPGRAQAPGPTSPAGSAARPSPGRWARPAGHGRGGSSARRSTARGGRAPAGGGPRHPPRAVVVPAAGRVPGQGCPPGVRTGSRRPRALCTAGVQARVPIVSLATTLAASGHGPGSCQFPQRCRCRPLPGDPRSRARSGWPGVSGVWACRGRGGEIRSTRTAAGGGRGSPGVPSLFRAGQVPDACAAQLGDGIGPSGAVPPPQGLVRGQVEEPAGAVSVTEPHGGGCGSRARPSSTSPFSRGARGAGWGERWPARPPASHDQGLQHGARPVGQDPRRGVGQLGRTRVSRPLWSAQLLALGRVLAAGSGGPLTGPRVGAADRIGAAIVMVLRQGNRTCPSRRGADRPWCCHLGTRPPSYPCGARRALASVGAVLAGSS